MASLSLRTGHELWLFAPKATKPGGCLQLRSHPGPGVPGQCHQIGRVSADTGFASTRTTIFSYEAWEVGWRPLHVP